MKGYFVVDYIVVAFPETRDNKQISVTIMFTVYARMIISYCRSSTDKRISALSIIDGLLYFTLEDTIICLQMWQSVELRQI